MKVYMRGIEQRLQEISPSEVLSELYCIYTYMNGIQKIKFQQHIENCDFIKFVFKLVSVAQILLH